MTRDFSENSGLPQNKHQSIVNRKEPKEHKEHEDFLTEGNEGNEERILFSCFLCFLLLKMVWEKENRRRARCRSQGVEPFGGLFFFVFFVLFVVNSLQKT